MSVQSYSTVACEEALCSGKGWKKNREEIRKSARVNKNRSIIELFVFAGVGLIHTLCPGEYYEC